MTNILAIAQKELRSYFASPIAYVVIGLWTLLYGFFFASLLGYFVRQSMQMSQFGGQQPVNVNEQMIRLLFQNTTILVEETVRIEGGYAYAPDRPGHGIRLSDRARAEFRCPEAGQETAARILPAPPIPLEISAA